MRCPPPMNNGDVSLPRGGSSRMPMSMQEQRGDEEREGNERRGGTSIIVVFFGFFFSECCKWEANSDGAAVGSEQISRPKVHICSWSVCGFKTRLKRGIAVSVLTFADPRHACKAAIEISHGPHGWTDISACLRNVLSKFFCFFFSSAPLSC